MIIPRLQGVSNLKGKQVLVCVASSMFLLVGCARLTATPRPTTAVEGSLGSTLAPDITPIVTETLSRPLASPTPAATPTPAYPGVYAGTPTPDPPRADVSTHSGPEKYIVRPGDTLSGIAWAFDCTVADLVRVNGLSNANAIWVGQKLSIPVPPTVDGPAFKLVPIVN